MAIFAVTYDLNKKKDYQKLWDEFDRLGGKKAVRSFYLVNVDTDNSKDVLNHLKDYIDDDDTLLVVKTDVDDIEAKRPLKGTFDWIKNNR